MLILDDHTDVCNWIALTDSEGKGNVSRIVSDYENMKFSQMFLSYYNYFP